MNKLSSLIRNYGMRQLSLKDCDSNPFIMFEKWLNEALQEEPFEANAMTVATVNALNEPSSRVVLLKEVTEHSLIFYTNYNSAKCQDLLSNQSIAGNFWWPKSERQVRFKGLSKKTSSEKSDSYFNTRDRLSQLGAHASAQSNVIADRRELDNRFKEIDKQYANKPVPRPENWGGIEILVSYFEFWQGGPNRLHDRFAYTKDSLQNWILNRLAP